MTMPQPAYREILLLPSILSADFCHLAAEVDRVMDAGVSVLHVDVMDGHFVPNLTIGPPVVSCVARHVHDRGGFISAHLMIERPEDYLKAFVDAGADAVSVHVEACTQLYHALEAIRALGAGAGVALNPGTDPRRIADVLQYADYVLVMTVNPGFGGQEMIERALEKVPVLRRMVPEGVAIEVDGGIHRGNIRRVVEAGANWLVTGSALFGAADPAVEARVLQGLMAGEPRMC
jgi:ribulose-phosphate 3-epimerase